jgi:hypothetical protein
MRIRTTLPVLAAVAAATLPAPAHAAPIIECAPIHGAPALRDFGGGDFRVYYYHQCNVDPTAAGVTQMYSYVGDVGPSDNEQYRLAGARVQQSAAYYDDGVATGSGYRKALNILTLVGDFTYGSVPGCYRRYSDTVVCQWYGAPTYVQGTQHTVTADLPDVLLAPVPLEDAPL